VDEKTALEYSSFWFRYGFLMRNFGQATLSFRKGKNVPMISTNKIKNICSGTTSFCSSLFYLSARIMWSIYIYIHLLLYFFTFYIIAINTRAINDNELIEGVVDTFPVDTDDDQQAEILLTNYRHRLEHSPNLKKLEWAFESQSDLAYCDFCDLVVPLVNISIKSLSSFDLLSFHRFDYLLKQIILNNLKISLMIFVKISGS
jgi:hypothetical protein